MDILHLVDRLEELFNESRAIPLTRSVVLDGDRMIDIIDQMRVSIPEEIKKAQQVMAQRDRLLAQAQEEANRIRSMAREEVEQKIEQSQLVQAAQVKADQLLAQARLDVEETKHDADEYVIDTLSQLEMELDRFLNQVRNGIRTLQNPRMPQQGPRNEE